MKRWLSLLLALCLCVVVMLALCASVSAKSECRLYDMTLKTESGEVAGSNQKWSLLGYGFREKDRQAERDNFAGDI